MKLLRRSYLWAPLIKSSLCPVDQICCDHAGDGKYKDADKNLIGLERRASHGNHKPNPRSSGIELSNHDPDERPADPQPQTSENEWHRRGNHHALKDLPLGCAKAPGGGEEVMRRGFYAVASVDD